MTNYTYTSFDYKGTPLLIAKIDYEAFRSLKNQAHLVTALETLHPDKAVFVQGPNIRGVEFVGFATEPKYRAVAQEIYRLLNAGIIQFNPKWSEGNVDC